MTTTTIESYQRLFSGYAGLYQCHGGSQYRTKMNYWYHRLMAATRMRMYHLQNTDDMQDYQPIFHTGTTVKVNHPSFQRSKARYATVLQLFTSSHLEVCYQDASTPVIVPTYLCEIVPSRPPAPLPVLPDERVTLYARIREMDCAEIEAFLDAPPKDEQGYQQQYPSVMRACQKQWQQLTDEPFPYTF